MALLEKYSPRRIQLDIGPDTVYPGSGDRRFLPGDSLDLLNGRYLDAKGKRYRLRNIPGTVFKDAGLAAGTNKTIGSFLCQKYNTVIYLVYNSAGGHRIIEYNPATDTFQTLLSGSSLQFTVDNMITQGGTIDDLFIFNDRNNRMIQINIVRARAGAYVPPYNLYSLALATKPPLDAPTGVIIESADPLISLISDDTWQFTHRYIYFNNEVSTFGPLSKLVWPGLDINPVTTTERAIQVTVPFALQGIVSKIEFAFRRGNNGSYTIFNTVVNPTGPTVTVTFRNNEDQTVVSAEDEARLVDNVPDKTEAMAIMDSRVFAVANEEGFAEHQGVIFNIGLGTYNIDDEEYAGKRWAKEGGIYGVGVVFFDEFGKSSFVEQRKIMNVPYAFSRIDEELPVPGEPGETYIVQHPVRRAITWAISGTAPAYAKKYQIVMSRDRFYSNYFQCECYPRLYVREIVEGETDGTQTTDMYFWQGRAFRKMANIVNTTSIRYKYVYLQLPSNIPFVPDSSCFVRFNSPNWPPGAKRIVPIIAVSGGFVVIDLRTTVYDLVDPQRQERSHYFQWEIFSPTSVEIYLPNTNPDPRFYEVSEIFDVNGSGGYTVTSGRIYGETFNFKNSQIPYTFTELAITGDPITHGTPDTTRQTVYESPSGILSTTVMKVARPVYSYARGQSSIVGASGEDISLLSGFISESLGSGVGGSDTTAQQKLILTQVKTLDYAKASSDWGRPRIAKPGATRKNYFNTVVFGEQYVQDTDINGLPAFAAANRFTIPVERSPIRALLPVGNVLLAIHERNVTSLYLGQGKLLQGDTVILVDNDKVIGDDNKLQGTFGTINPESVINIDDDGYWWDGLRGAVMRYTKAGLFPISYYGMEAYFEQKARDYAPYRATAKIVTGYDHQNKEFLISFPSIPNKFPGETWAFHILSEVWCQRYSYFPDVFCGTGEELYSFKNGGFWVHHRNPIHNNFYGEQWPRIWKFAANPYPGKNKRFLNIHIDGEMAQNMGSDFQAINFYTKEGQQSYTPLSEFEKEEYSKGKWCGPILRDILSYAQAGENPLRSGDYMVSNYLEVEIYNDRTDEGACSEVNIVYIEENFSV